MTTSADTTTGPQVGDEAPDFELPTGDRSRLSLSSFRGQKNVVLLFYPMAFTGTCTGELCAIRDQIADFSNDDVQTLAVSCDCAPSLGAYAQQEGYTFPLLADFWPHGDVARAYGVFDEQSGLALRGTFVIDKAGVVRYRVRNGIPDARDEQEYLAVLRGL